MTQHTIDLIADAIRWWGAIAGLLGLHDFRRRWKLWKIKREFLAIREPWIDIGGKVAVCAFLVLAGFGIPVARRFGVDLQGPSFSAYMTLAWACASGGGWAYVVSRSGRAGVMVAVACGLFAVMLLASWATVHA